MGKQAPRIYVPTAMLGQHVRPTIEEFQRQLNNAFQDIQNQLNQETTTDTGAPPSPTSFSGQALNHGVWLTWNTVHASYADGYEVAMATDTDFGQIVGRWRIPSVKTNSIFVPVGISGIARYFKIYSTNGRSLSIGSNVITVTPSANADTRFVQTSVLAGDTVNTTISDTNFATQYAVPANDWEVGAVYRLTARGLCSFAVSGHQLIYRVKFGSTTLATSAQNRLIGAPSNMAWELRCDVTCITVGATGTVEVQGTMTEQAFNAQVSSAGFPNTAVVTIDTTAAANLIISVQPSASNAGTGSTMRQLIIEKLIAGTSTASTPPAYSEPPHEPFTSEPADQGAIPASER